MDKYDQLKEEGLAEMEIARGVLGEKIDTDPVALSMLTGLSVKKIWAIKEARNDGVRLIRLNWLHLSTLLYA